MNKIELLAPAGNFECLVAAVQSGADAVYISGKAFGARSFADNFDNPQLEKAVDYCHIRNTKVYVTVNTLVSDDEFDAVSEYLRFLSNIGVDAIIVQDVGIVGLAKRIVPDLPIHASTQMTVHNSAGVKFLENQGIKRIVLSREVSLSNIEKISTNTTAELEVFAHGALCMCYSGQCLMSSIIGGRSGNRGKCAQPCRLPYTINGGKNKKFYMSLKDLSSLAHIPKLQEIGVSSLKIEGRMKGPAYVAAVTGIYRKYIDNPCTVEKSDIELLDRIFNRGGVTDGYLTGKTGRDMFAFDKPDNPYHKGSDKLEQELLSKIKTENRKMYLKCNVQIKLGKRPYISVENTGIFAEFQADDVAETAQNVPTSKEAVLKQMEKTGSTPFAFSNINVTIDDNVFVSVGTLNNMRRTVLKLFEDKYIGSFKRIGREIKTENFTEKQCRQGGFVCEITNIEQLRAVKTEDFAYFYVPLHLIEQYSTEISEFKEKTVIVLPAIIQESDVKNIEARTKNLAGKGFAGVVASNLSQLKQFQDVKLFGGFRLNIFNTEALSFYKSAGVVAAEVSPELSIKQIEKIKKVISVQTMVYGRLPIMVTENCVIKNAAKCPCNNNNFITDRLGMTFPVIKDGEKCRSVVLNCKKTFLGFDMDKLKKANVDFFRIYFSDESPEECVCICDSFFRNSGYRPENFTNGHLFKGVL